MSHWQALLVAMLVFLFFEVGYLWAGAGHSPRSAWHAATWLDGQIPLVPLFIVFYMLGYFFVLSPAFILRERCDFQAGIAVFVLMLGCAFLIFHLFPVYMHKQIAMGSDFFSSLTRHQQRMDVPYNNLPSLHVTLNVYAWLLIFHQAGRRALWWLPLPICIVVSTVLVKQHLLLDLLGGLVLATAGFLLWRWLRRRDWIRFPYWTALAVMLVALLGNAERIEQGLIIATSLLGKAVGLGPG
jgi:membrane-associated phospholipid phosphatase